MDDRLKESLSVMFDDEADELTVRRVLAHAKGSEQVETQWARWQRLSDHMGGHHERWNEIDLRAGIWAQLEEAPAEQPPAVAGAVAARPQGMARGGQGRTAVAAMFVVALVVGFGAGQQWSGDGGSSDRGASLAGASAMGAPALVAEIEAEANVPNVELQNLDAQQWEQLSDYLLRHAQHNSVAAGRGAVGFARVASVSPGNP